LIVIWGAYGLGFYLLHQNKFVPEEVSTVSGVSISGACGRTGQRDTVEFLAEYVMNEERVEDVVWLELGQKCDDELLRHFEMTKISKTVFRNANLGLEADGLVIRAMESGISEFADFRGTYVFMTFLAVLISVGGLFAAKQRN
tara:strand:+ start:117 stop:545 length:429 start_codon:yes stop_codon:yes gene_type:complete